ncbi:MAG TPA: 50S ribosomal protein L9 [Thermomicrobiales bacterium]|nr:50S ribosomal protein L9 [Thermomicrobiales bacterium]
MKIVLRQDVPKVGDAGTIQTVSSGYARNYLIPQGLAVVATDGEIRTANHNLAVKDRKIARQEEAQRSLAEKISGKVLTFTARAGEQGRLYGSITASDVATELSKMVSEEIDRRRVVLDDPLRTVGEHTVTVHLVGRLRPQVTVIIAAEATEDEASAEAEVEVEAPATDEPDAE